MKTFSIEAGWDQEAGVWVVLSSQVPSLATESETLDGLAAKLSCMIPELLESNGVVVDSYCVRVLHHTI